MAIWLEAWIGGLFAGSALIIGALVGYSCDISQRMVASVMAFGSGVLISALSFTLMNDAYSRGGFLSTSGGFLLGAVLYSAADCIISRKGGKNRKRSGQRQPSEHATPGSGMAIAMGSVLDDIPESVVIGVSLLAGVSVSLTTVTAIFLSNVPEALSSSAGMRIAGRSKLFVLGLWGLIAALTSLGSLVGFLAFRHLGGVAISAAMATAAGAIIAMLANTMMPEAYEEARNSTGVITVLGFLTAFALTKMHRG